MTTRHQTTINRQQGFTILELLIATTVLSIILVMVTTIMISIGHLYYKGINTAAVQDATRTITDQLSRDLKLNSGAVTSDGSATVTLASTTVTFQTLCIGKNVRYTYVTGYKIGSGTEPSSANIPYVDHILWRDDNSFNDTTNTNGFTQVNANATCKPVNLTNPSLASLDSTGSAELISPNSRLTWFKVVPGATATIYDVSVGVAYGDIDLLSNITPGTIDQNTVCKGDIGDQFCATAILLNTTVVQRIQ